MCRFGKIADQFGSRAAQVVKMVGCGIISDQIGLIELHRDTRSCPEKPRATLSRHGLPKTPQSCYLELSRAAKRCPEVIRAAQSCAAQS